MEADKTKKAKGNKTSTIQSDIMNLDFSSEQLENFKAQSMHEAEHVIKELFPQKVLELNAMLDSQKLSLSRLENISVDLNIPFPSAAGCAEGNVSKKRRVEEECGDEATQGSKVYALPGGVVTCNTHIVDIVDTIKPLLRELIDHANKVKMWIIYLIPRIEDGNNFGVSIQEETLNEARQVEADAATYLDQVSRYFLTRGKLVTKVAKYPHVADYRVCVKELDEKEFISLRLMICEVRNHYATLHDIILKNIEKIKKPRSNHIDNMY